MKKFSFLAATLLLAFSIFLMAKIVFVPKPIVRVGTENYAPFIFLNKRGEATGISVSILDKLSIMGDFSVAYSPIAELPELLKKLQANEVDVVTSLKRTPERESIALFTKPYLVVSSVLISPKDKPQVVCVGEGFAIAGWIKDTHPELSIVTAGNDQECASMVLAGKADGAAMDEIALLYVSDSLKISGWKQKPLDFSYELCFAVSKKKPKLVDLLNRQLTVNADVLRRLSR